MERTCLAPPDQHAADKRQWAGVHSEHQIKKRLTARLAPDKPMQHAMVLGAVGVVLGLIGMVATWDLGLGPRWYPILLVVLALPQCWAGAKLYEMQADKR